MDSENYGIVYALTNRAMPGLVKIGMTTKQNPKQRLRDLYSTGVPVPFECEYACKVPVQRAKELESALHKTFAPYRINIHREFFEVPITQVIPILQYIDNDITDEVNKELNSGLSVEDIVASNNLRSKRPVINYFEIGLHQGDTIRMVGRTDVIAEIVDGRHVKYNGEISSLTAITKEILNLKLSIQPSGKWETVEDNPRNLSDLYEATYGATEEE